MNICYNCIDRHVDEGRGDEPAMFYDCAYTGVQKAYTFREMQINVAKMASMMKEHFGVNKGDRVLIYMPMVPEAAFAM